MMEPIVATSWLGELKRARLESPLPQAPSVAASLNPLIFHLSASISKMAPWHHVLHHFGNLLAWNVIMRRSNCKHVANIL